jgi:hypothetical protein
LLTLFGKVKKENTIVDILRRSILLCQVFLQDKDKQTFPQAKVCFLEIFAYFSKKSKK